VRNWSTRSASAGRAARPLGRRLDIYRRRRGQGRLGGSAAGGGLLGHGITRNLTEHYGKTRTNTETQTNTGPRKDTENKEGHRGTEWSIPVGGQNYTESRRNSHREAK